MGRSSVMDLYMVWYRTITRLRITNPMQQQPSTHYQPMSSDIRSAQSFAAIHQRSWGVMQAAENLPPAMGNQLFMETLAGISQLCVDSVNQLGYGHMLHSSATPAHHASSSAAAMYRPPPIRPPVAPFTSPPPMTATYRRISDVTPSSLHDITELDESTPGSSTDPTPKRSRRRP